jgi:lysosomal Pro-X carboxypeptidase
MFYYTQTLDHFNYKPESYTTFRQRYVIDFRYWGGANTSAPIFVFFGAEEDLDDDLDAIGFLSDNAPHFKALLIYIEVRYAVLYTLILGIFVIKFLIFLSSQVPLFL